MSRIHNYIKDESYDFESFKEQMLNICAKHKADGRAQAFAFILFDFTNPHISKIINDRDYWLAFDEISGEYLTVFTLHYKDKNMADKDFDIRKRVFYRLTNVTTDKNPSKCLEEIVKQYFGENYELKFPAVLFFQVNDNRVSDSLLIELKEEAIEPAFMELRDYIKSAVKAIKSMDPVDSKNSTAVFDTLESSVKSTKWLKSIKRVIKDGGNILGLISSVKGLL